MRFIHAIIEVKPEKAELYAKTCLELRKDVLENEPGTIFEIALDPDKPNTFRIFEGYPDQAAIQMHISQDYYHRAANIFVECMAGDHMEEITRRGLTGRAMYDLVKSVTMERFDTLE